jgi:hypothetical protein
MSSRYDVIGPDTLEEMRRAGHIAKLEARIEKLEAALREIASVSKVYVANGEDMARALTTLLASHRKIALTALEGKDD